MERIIGRRRSLNRIERHTIIQQHRQERTQGIGGRLQHTLLLRIIDDDIRRYGTGSHRISNGKRQTRLGIKVETYSILIFAMGKKNGIGVEITGASCRCPVFAFGQTFGYTRAFAIRLFAQTRFFGRQCMDILHRDMGFRQRITSSLIKGIDVEQRFTLFDAFSLRLAVFLLRRFASFLGRFTSRRIAFTFLCFPFLLCCSFLLLRTRRRSGFRSSVEGLSGDREHKDRKQYEPKTSHCYYKNRRVVAGLSSCRGPTWA